MSATPITFLPPKDVLPRKYVMHVRTVCCAACGSEAKYSEFYGQTEFLGRTGMGVGRQFVPMDRIDYNLPIEVKQIAFSTVPVCHACVGTIDLSAKPDPRGTDDYKRLYAPSWAGTAAPATGKTKSPAKPKTIDDLLDI